MTLKKRLLLTLLLVGLLPVIAISFFNAEIARQSLTEQALQQLSIAATNKQHSVEDYLSTIARQLKAMANNRGTRTAAQGFGLAFQNYEKLVQEEQSTLRENVEAYYQQNFLPPLQQNGGANGRSASDFVASLSKNSLALQMGYIVDNPNPVGQKDELVSADVHIAQFYNTLHKQWHTSFKEFQEAFGYYDIYLIDADTGHVIYSVAKEVDFATSLKDGPYADSGLAAAYRQAMSDGQDTAPTFVDFTRYVPSYGAPAGFVATPIYSEKDERLAVLAFQFPIDSLNNIMMERDGMGETGDAYLVGPDNLMRSDSYLDPENRSVVASFADPENGRISSTSVDEALAGNSGEGVVTSYRGEPVFSAHRPVTVGGLNWALVAEISEDEALAPVREMWTLAAIAIAIVLLAVAAVAVWTAVRIMKPLGKDPSELQALAEQVAAGNLVIDSSDSDNATGVYGSMLKMVSDLKEVIFKVEEASQRQASGISERAGAVVLRLREAVEEVARMSGMAEQIATASEEQSATAEEVTRNVSTIAEKSLETKQAMVQISEASGDLAELSHQLRDSLSRFKVS
ncbi:cache domain-containing protein [Marinobacter flavimaris]|uniref:cache domain-containing protein n=1 Tax=Marinobacter flavimaris TaxID=262076 RepID=UPI00387024D8